MGNGKAKWQSEIAAGLLLFVVGPVVCIYLLMFVVVGRQLYTTFVGVRLDYTTLGMGAADRFFGRPSLRNRAGTNRHGGWVEGWGRQGNSGAEAMDKEKSTVFPKLESGSLPFQVLVFRLRSVVALCPQSPRSH